MPNKKIYAAITAIMLILFSLCSCGTSSGSAKTEVIIFAAASLTGVLEETAVLYTAQNPDTELIFNFDSSGTLKTQIQQGARCDIFISAGQLQVDQLDITAPADINTQGPDFIESETRIDLLQNRIVLAVPKDNPKNIHSFADLAQALIAGDILLAMGNSDVPAGQYAQQILEYYGLDENKLAATGVISYGSNVKEVTAQIAEGAVDCGIIYQTDAFSAGLDITDYATEDMCTGVIYPAAIIKNSRNSQAARKFLNFLTTDEAAAVFEKAGFSRG